MKKPNTFLIGGPKCGTTSLYWYLRSHPSVFAPANKEPHYFSNDLRHGQVAKLVDYETLYADAKKDTKIVIDASVYYLYSRVAVANILEYCAAPKFIVMIRNPIEMAHALFAEERYAGHEDIDDFRTAWEAQEERRLGRRIPKGCREPKMLLYGDVCALGRQLSALAARVDLSNIHFVFLEDIASGYERVAMNICQFLDIEYLPELSFEKKNVRKSVRSRMILDVLKRANRIKNLLGIKLNTGWYGRLHQLNTKSEQHRSPDPDTRKSMIEYFSDDVRLLETITQRNLASWLAE